jgi:hypothetical protein
LALPLLVAGCGGSSDSSSAAGGQEVTVTSGSLSKAEFVKQADTICEGSRSKFDKLLSEYAAKHKPGANLAGWIDEVVHSFFLPTYENEIEQIAALGAPRGDEEKVASFLDALQKRLDEVDKVPVELSKTTTPLKGAEKLAKAYGLTGCAESFS